MLAAMTARAPSRLGLFLGSTFALTWICWWSLAALARGGATAYGAPAFMAAYVLGGLGPTVGAYVAVVATRRVLPLREYHQRLARWRVGASWYAAALGLPVALALGARWLQAAVEPGPGDGPAPEPWQRLLPVFLTMVVGGGLEELGWRGVLQPELERRMARLPATSLAGAIWAAWHLPLFHIPGVPQQGQSFFIFGAEVLGTAFLLAWLYAGTGSILLCVLFHAAQNTSSAMGYGLPPGHDGARLGAAVVKLLLGVALVVVSAPGARRRRETGPAS
jgi:membrane protease YdiL (CAAX protease family)